MTTVSPPKPWERNRNPTSLPSSSPSPPTSATSTATATQSTGASNGLPSSTTSSSAPAIPQRPSSLNNVVNRTASSYSNPNNATSSSLVNRPYGSSPYGYGSSYSSPYGYGSSLSRFGGGYGSGMYGGMYGGGMGGMYGGGYGGGMYGGGMYGGGMPGQQQDPNDPNSMTNNFAQSTQATFQIIESIVGAFGGFAQMLESTYMATHSSFFAMVNVAEQFGNLRQTLGSILGIYTLLRWLRTLVAKLTGRPPPADATALTPSAFAAFSSGAPASSTTIGADGRPIPRPSKKPFIVFILAVFGLPYLMGKLIRALARGQEAALSDRQNQQAPPGSEAAQQGQNLDPSRLDFCRVLYDFPPAEAVSQGAFNGDIDLSVKKGDLVAVLDKSNPDGSQQQQQAGSGESEWWLCRARDGRVGYLPAVFLETIQRRQQVAQITTGSGESRANSMPGSLANVDQSGKIGNETGGFSTGRAQTMSDASHANGLGPMKDLRQNSLKGHNNQESNGLEAFQKAWANER